MGLFFLLPFGFLLCWHFGILLWLIRVEIGGLRSFKGSFDIVFWCTVTVTSCPPAYRILSFLSVKFLLLPQKKKALKLVSPSGSEGYSLVQCKKKTTSGGKAEETNHATWGTDLDFRLRLSMKDVDRETILHAFNFIFLFPTASHHLFVIFY